MSLTVLYKFKELGNILYDKLTINRAIKTNTACVLAAWLVPGITL